MCVCVRERERERHLCGTRGSHIRSLSALMSSLINKLTANDITQEIPSPVLFSVCFKGLSLEENKGSQREEEKFSLTVLSSKSKPNPKSAFFILYAENLLKKAPDKEKPMGTSRPWVSQWSLSLCGLTNKKALNHFPSRTSYAESLVL